MTTPPGALELHHLVVDGRTVCGAPYTEKVPDDDRPWCEVCRPVWHRWYVRGHRD